ncbi:glycosyltransferase family 22 protein [Suhomyces tanzawaensis NRRL Y-17324]|uniref:Mannosyltransferase n=1 Tax=Suhomyces tanzawaensis NRRL Y-17324 TaxID=984487 RepID=A0A1E4SHF8_9ASCO|nr:glycosyltransferase family 22 protein [Suhomyces tanzawaensis NRRL Y-17324]ODV78941.1 glycosyltransferase family 22 protein [Suhomyces tanzawaensis NRRL Y-17324]
MALSVNWRLVYFLSIGLRFVFALSNSYIHPDEHFQSLEVLSGRILGYSSAVPWEFGQSAARSLAPLYLLYGPVLYFVKFTGIDLSPMQIWYVLRLQNMIIGWIITDKVLYAVLPTKPERIKAVFFTLTSYVTLVYQSHLFSNSIETWALLVSVMIIDNLRYISELDDVQLQQVDQSQPLFWLGVVVSLGTFNRVTFPAFLVIPAWFVLQYLWAHKKAVLYVGLGFVLLTAGCILFDTVAFGNDPWSYDFVVAPWNNLVYNSNYSNLAHHGIHPLYNHLLVNLPQIVGPGLLFVAWRLRNKYWKTLPFLSGASGLVILSLVPHQELRFLVPILPLVCCCSTPRSSLVSGLIYLWYAFNTVMAVIMGVYHQGGVVPVLDHFHTQYKSGLQNTIQVWWRTYTPPTWILGDDRSSLQIVSGLNYTMDVSKSNYVFDTMGSPVEEVKKLLGQLSTSGKKVYLITPVASFNLNFNQQSYNQTYSYDTHLDMDHLDFSDWQSLTPGLGVYELL